MRSVIFLIWGLDTYLQVCRFLVPRIYALSGGISSNEKRGRLHILLLIIRNF